MKSFKEFLLEGPNELIVRPASAHIDSPFGIRPDGTPITTPNQDGGGEDDDEDGPIGNECPWGPCEEMVPPCDYYGGDWCEEWEGLPFGDPEWCDYCCGGYGCWGHMECYEGQGCVFWALDGSRWVNLDPDGACAVNPAYCFWNESDPWYGPPIDPLDCPWGPCDTMPPCDSAYGNWCEYWDYDDPPEYCPDCCGGAGCWGRIHCENGSCGFEDIGGFYWWLLDENGQPCSTVDQPNCTWQYGGIWYEPGLISDMDWMWIWMGWAYWRAWMAGWLRVHKWPGVGDHLNSTWWRQIFRFFMQPHGPDSMARHLRAFLQWLGWTGAWNFAAISAWFNLFFLRLLGNPANNIPMLPAGWFLYMLHELAEILGITVEMVWDFFECVLFPSSCAGFDPAGGGGGGGGGGGYNPGQTPDWGTPGGPYP